MKAGVNDYISKPIKKEELIIKTSTLLKFKASLDAKYLI